MRLAQGRRPGRGTAAAVAVAVLGGLLGGAQTAVAAPGAPGTVPRTPAGPEGRNDGSVPPVWPRPQSLKPLGPAVALGTEATVVAGPDADPYAVETAHRLLRDAGVGTLYTTLPGRGPVVHLGGPGAVEALRALGMAGQGDLPSGGYRLAAGALGGRGTVAVDGTGPDGLFHGVQTLRQLVRGGTAADKDKGAAARTVRPSEIAGVAVRDWPGTAVRGTTEGFYGRPWSHEQRLAQLDFMGRTKQNRYLYAPGDDPFRQARWRDPYPAERRTEFRELADRARRNHTVLAWAVSPGQRMCLSDAADVRALNRKIDAMWALGVRAFQLQFQDVSYSEWHCEEDAETFGRGPGAAARAQARVAGAVARHLAERHPGAEPLSLLPTEFYQEGETAYRRALAAELDQRVQVAWTGVGVVPRTITGRQVAGAREAFGHPLVTMDNYPVNDYAQNRLFLGPYAGREPAVAAGSAALLANAMEQASASRIPLFTAADYAWNPKGYRPGESWRAALDELADGDRAAREALGVLAGNHASSVLEDTESGYLRPYLDAFRDALAAGTAPAALDRAADALRARFTEMRRAPEGLADTDGGRLDDEIRPWLDQLARYGQAGELAVDLLRAQARGDGTAAWRASLALEPLRTDPAKGRAVVGKGVLEPFLDRVAADAAAWTGAARSPRPDGEGVVRLERARPVASVTAMTVPGAPGTAPGRLEALIPGEGWRAVGVLSPTGWTQSAVGGLPVEALRVAGGGPGTAVRALVPWYTDEPAAGVALTERTADAEIGGAPVRAGLRLSPLRPRDVTGTLTVKAPPGIAVKAPARVTVPRGRALTVPVEVTVPAGAPSGPYPVTLSFAGTEQTLTVRAYPRTGGPGLLAGTGAVASSSGDETPAFPAAAAVDGDPRTRWSSRYEDGAWWQAELPEAVRLGKVVLHWQDAHAAGYRIQVSADGRTWRTAATVGEGRGGTETVRMDAPGTRFLRVQGDRRATRFGYSLFTVEAYAVAAEKGGKAEKAEEAEETVAGDGGPRPEAGPGTEPDTGRAGGLRP
ncbi:beta-N-acetylglucosaminidase domain-containing protein [Streptomyces tsukubensis]|uniref:beta-N-acetylglucosaminidase domain-containing protein n=2 Tax=Streptomyces TaxID=1883 RepID=UPI001E3C71D4|nr:beta-N-acetylglucosaminidase domain-containing protein [Streptomyces tsukubensis]